VQQLISRQNPDGGWGYWPGQASSSFVTAYVLWGLNSADALGYPVAIDNRNRAADYLTNTFTAPADAANNWQLNEMAFTHYVLAEMERGDAGRMSTLYDGASGWRSTARRSWRWRCTPWTPVTRACRR
jgi:uncharacterized protein YfaS (alpha-2-macroglobulin family)